MLKLLKDVKKGSYVRVIVFDKEKNLTTTQLRYNKLGRKFYLTNSNSSVWQKRITGKVATKLILQTLQIKQYADERSKIKANKHTAQAESSTELSC